VAAQPDGGVLPEFGVPELLVAFRPLAACSWMQWQSWCFLAALPAPMALTSIELENGRTVIGLAAIHDATTTATDITTTEVGRNG
jgi:hypothetical protein